MAESQYQTDCNGNRRPAQKKAKPSTKSIKRKSLKPTSMSKVRARVDIGSAFERWIALKKAKGLNSNREVAACLLDAMESTPSGSASTGSSNGKMKFSQLELQALVEQEVHRAVTKKESKLQGWIETLLELERCIDFEGSVQKLEAKINTLTTRAEAAIAHMSTTEEKSALSSLLNVGTIRSNSADEQMETVSQVHRKSPGETAKRQKHLEIKVKAERALEEIHSEKEALMAAMADLREDELPPTVHTPFSSFLCKKDEDVDHFEETFQFEDQKAETVKLECLSAGNPKSSAHTVSEQDNLRYPPLPATTFPSVLNMEAASFNIPQQVKVRLALIRKPPGLSVLWNVQPEDPCAPPMQSYRIYITMEKGKGSGSFGEWNILGEVKADRLPMCVLISKYKPGHKLCVAVVGKDKFSRYGPYSEVVTAAVPE
ncbi:activating transcription factor 7-interacting protein 2 isoform X1 [Labrus mixtus]|uniref:activating transcription factor 7-interacting protein 2 isoform X1 n=1 Tax=Labrus mixtus TaxID=508554 RepID=UPI0029C06FF7|nr:activating transcription factor 7-interacting protein 2 isoform X1 [Labrus mixtus]